MSESLKYRIRETIRKNYNKRGYWKASLVCIIASYGYVSMIRAWEIFKDYMQYHQDKMQKVWDKVGYEGREERFLDELVKSEPSYYGMKSGNFTND